MFITSGIYQIATSIDGKYCFNKDAKCSDDFLSKFSSYHKKDDSSKITSVYIANWLTLLTVLICFVLCYFYRESII